MAVALITADWHICTGGRIWTYRKEPAGDVFYAIRQIIDLCVEHEVKYLILAGDLLDAPKNHPTAIAILRELGSLPLKILYVQGQHDLSPVPWLQAINLPNAEWIHKKTVLIPELNCSAFGLDWSAKPKEELENLYSGESILITHQVWQDFVPNGTISFADLPEGLELVISGDYHFPVTDFRCGVQVLIPGDVSPTSTMKDEYAVILLNEDLSFNKVSLRHRKTVHFTVNTEEDIDALERQYPPELLYDASLPEELRKPILFLRCSSGNLINIVAAKYKDVFLHLLPAPAVEQKNEEDGRKVISQDDSFENNIKNVLASMDSRYVVNFIPAYSAIVSGDIPHLVDTLMESCNVAEETEN